MPNAQPGRSLTAARRALALSCVLLLTHVHAAFNETAWQDLRHVQLLLQESACLLSAQPCSVANAPNCASCEHGAHILPWLMRRYDVRTAAEVGVCTGMTVAHVVNQFACETDHIRHRHGVGGLRRKDLRGKGGNSSLDRYYMIDPWGGQRCRPGCACARQLQQMAGTWPDVLTPLRGYSTAMALHIPNATLDLAFIDAAHDLQNVHADALAFWPKLKSTGILAGHDFGHWRNHAEVRQDMIAANAGDRKSAARIPAAAQKWAKKRKLPPAYGVVQATHDLFRGCHLHVKWNVWWVERANCELPLKTELG